MLMKKRKTGIAHPLILDHQNLSVPAKVIFTYLTFFIFKKDDIIPSGNRIRKDMNISLAATQSAIKNLLDEGFLIKTELKVDEIVEILRNKQPQKCELFNHECEWCQSDCMVLHNHHYPIPKHLGGTDTIPICPNCHSEFHRLEGSGLIRVNPDYLGWLELDEYK